MPHRTRVGDTFPGRIFSVFSPDGRRVLSTSSDHTTRLWDADVGQLLLTFEGYNLNRILSKPGVDLPDLVFGPVLSAVFEPNGGRVLTPSSNDKAPRIWDDSGN